MFNKHGINMNTFYAPLNFDQLMIIEIINVCIFFGFCTWFAIYWGRLCRDQMMQASLNDIVIH